MSKVSKCAARLTKDDSDNPWTEMAGRPCIETEGAPTAADNDSYTMDEISVWMAKLSKLKRPAKSKPRYQTLERVLKQL